MVTFAPGMESGNCTQLVLMLSQLLAKGIPAKLLLRHRGLPRMRERRGLLPWRRPVRAITRDHAVSRGDLGLGAALAAAGGSAGGMSADGLEEFRDIAKNSRLQDTLCRALIAHSEHPGMCEPCAELLALLVEKAHDATAVAAAGGVVAVCEAAQASPRHHGMQRSAAQVLRRVYSHLPAVTRAVTPHEESLALLDFQLEQTLILLHLNELVSE
jgi:hypothetical protein